MVLISSNFPVNFMYNRPKRRKEHLAIAFDSPTSHCFNGQLGRNYVTSSAFSFVFCFFPE